jgi:U3 small nucleolar RNA-associated protein MPP10
MMMAKLVKVCTIDFIEVPLKSLSLDIFYRDFFEPPPKIQKTSAKRSNNSGVRFHENVRVRKIKATGKNRSLRDPDDFILDEDEDDSGDDFKDEEDNLSSQGETQDSDDSSENGSNAGSNDESVEGTTIQRLRHDLFAEEVEDNDDGNILVRGTN